MKKLSAWWVVAGAGLCAVALGLGSCSGEGGDDKEPAPSAGGAGGTGPTTTISATGTAVVTTGAQTVGSGGNMGLKTKLGKSCTGDDQCGQGFHCILPGDNNAFLQGGAANGYCSKKCDGDAACEMEHPGSRCLPTGAAEGNCFLGCTTGGATAVDAPLDPNKCHARPDVRCEPDALGLSGVTACLPTCGKDNQCGGGFCNPRTGACVPQKPTGKKHGSLCDASAANRDGCLGLCQTFVNMTPSICVQACVYGGDVTNTDDCGGIENGVCVYKPAALGAGDFGRCAARCNQHDECGNPAWWCEKFNFAPHGYCGFGQPDCMTDADCPNAMASDSFCVDTKYGKKCLQYDPKSCTKSDDPNCKLRFPLGTAAPVGTGGAGGAGGAGGGP
jgi:hypothetical protein